MEKTNHTFIYRRCCYCPFVHPKGRDVGVTSMWCSKHKVSGKIARDTFIVNIRDCYYCPDANENILLDTNCQFTIY